MSACIQFPAQQSCPSCGKSVSEDMLSECAQCARTAFCPSCDACPYCEKAALIVANTSNFPRHVLDVVRRSKLKRALLSLASVSLFGYAAEAVLQRFGFKVDALFIDDFASGCIAFATVWYCN
jgi:hypothetical protein